MSVVVTQKPTHLIIKKNAKSHLTCRHACNIKSHADMFTAIHSSCNAILHKLYLIIAELFIASMHAY